FPLVATTPHFPEPVSRDPKPRDAAASVGERAGGNQGEARIGGGSGARGISRGRRFISGCGQACTPSTGRAGTAVANSISATSKTRWESERNARRVRHETACAIRSAKPALRGGVPAVPARQGESRRGKTDDASTGGNRYN